MRQTSFNQNTFQEQIKNSDITKAGKIYSKVLKCTEGKRKIMSGKTKKNERKSKKQLSQKKN